MARTIKTILFLVVVGLTVPACDSGGSGDDGDDGGDPPELIEKSEKRGLAYNLTSSADLEALKNGVSWWYNWHWTTSAPDGWAEDYQMEFLPMLWGHNGNDDFSNLKQFVLDNPEIEYLLVLNEPNLTDQANMSPQRAAFEWIKYEQFLADLEREGRTLSLVGPQITWGTLSGFEDPIVWMDAFYAEFNALNGRDPRIDYLAFHWYDYGLEEQLNRLAKYGKQIWVTEMANWNSQIDTVQKQIQQMTEMVALCERRADVFRYAWFMGRWNPDPHHTSVFDSAPGDLSDLGEIYVRLPY